MINDLHKALLDLIGVLHSPRMESHLMQNAGISLDRALFPLLLRIGMRGPIGVVKLAEQVGRDHSTVSRQIAKLESMNLIVRQPSPDDHRLKEASITEAGKQMVATLAQARDDIVEKALDGWSAKERTELTRLMRKLADAALAYAGQRTGKS